MQQYKNGLHNITNEQYHSSDGISRSMLMEFKRSPYHYWYKYLSGQAPKEEATPAMNLGSAVHTLTLEEHKFDSEFFVCSQKTKPRKGTPPYDKMIEEANGKIILTNDEYLQAAMMAKSVTNNEYARLLLDGCAVEQSIYFQDHNTGLQLKARPDAISGSIAIDLKTSSDASHHAFQGSAMRYGYFLQSAFIYNAMKSIGQVMDKYVFIVVEKEPPYCVATYILTDDALEYGLQQLDSLVKNLSVCIETNTWHGYGIQDLGLPGYAKFEELEN